MVPSDKPIKVLYVDDDEDDFLIARTIFAKTTGAQFLVDWVDDYKAAQKRIAENKHDLYLIDYRLGKDSGLDLLAWAEPQKRGEPFIILTGTGDERIEREAMTLGAADFLVKGTFSPELLSRALRYALQRKYMEEQRVQQLIEVSKAKDEFISLASHQLRTPATGVKQYIGMVLEGYAGELTEDQRALLREAYESNERQLQIVTDLLRVARVDAGKVKLQKSRVALGDLLEDILKEQQAKFANRQQNIVFNRPKKDILASVDQGKLRMVLENIIDNASKYSEEGKTISVNLEAKGGSIAIDVMDEGVGISPASQDKLFQKFSRIDNPLSMLVGGTGLGLYWAKHIIDLHEGHIQVKSAENKGSTFTIVLPAR